MNASTQVELERDCQAQLLILGNHLESNLLSVEDVGDFIPGNVMVQDFKTMTNVYMNRAGCEFLKYTSEELSELGPRFFEKFFPKEEMLATRRALESFLYNADEGSVHAHFQRMRARQSMDYQWFFTTSRPYPGQTKGDITKIYHVAMPADMLSYAGKKLGNIVECDAYIKKNYCYYCLLSPREREILSLIAGGESSSRIAETLFLSIHTVNNHRKNILNKLQIDSLPQLIKFAYLFGLI